MAETGNRIRITLKEFMEETVNELCEPRKEHNEETDNVNGKELWKKLGMS